jgi:acyl-CoA thioester hydrolase
LTRRQAGRVRVRFADTDAMGVVHHATYLEYFEVGRVEAMRQIGAAYSRAVERGVHIVVVEASVRYLTPARFDDVLSVSCDVGELGAVRFSFEYRVEREADAALVATGRTWHACVDAKSLRPTRMPSWLRDDLHLLRPRA